MLEDLPPDSDDIEGLAYFLVLFSGGARGAFLSGGGDSGRPGDVILQENGFAILQEQGGFILQEGP